jgi:glutamate decarboxylase
MTKQPLTTEQAELLFGNRFLVEDAPSDSFPEGGMAAVDAMRLVAEELMLEGEPFKNLATFVTTWMEPEAQRLIADGSGGGG